VAGLMVAMVSTPLSIGIAIASGAPPITGLTSAIIAGFILPFLGGSYVTISGPAAGLAPILLGAMLTLGQQDLAAGYPLLLPVICLAGGMQIVLSRFQAARFGAIFPTAVVQGMLTAIGLMILAKQLPMLTGHPSHAHGFWEIFFAAPTDLLLSTPAVLALGLLTLGLIFALAAWGRHIRGVRHLPPQLIAVVVGTGLGLALQLPEQFLLRLPDNPLAHGITFPDFAGLVSQSALWWDALSIAVCLTLVDGIESLATISAIDKIDPYRRTSDPNRTLFAMGVSNICSSLLGGLTIIPGGIKSTANIMAGGRTQWANFYNATFLLLILLFLRDWINAIPLTVLAAVLMYTGYQLCRPALWRQTAQVGLDQLAAFTVTVLVTLTTDLMWGILAGLVVSLVIQLALLALNGARAAHPVALLTSMFQNPLAPLTHPTTQCDHLVLTIIRPLTCFNYHHLTTALNQLGADCQRLTLVLTPTVGLVDATAAGNLQADIQRLHQDHGVTVERVDWDLLQPLSASERATRLMPGRPMGYSAKA
jgi:MFS superfamily sulfate permease-like transporter